MVRVNASVASAERYVMCARMATMVVIAWHVLIAGTTAPVRTVLTAMAHARAKIRLLDHCVRSALAVPVMTVLRVCMVFVLMALIMPRCAFATKAFPGPSVMHAMICGMDRNVLLAFRVGRMAHATKALRMMDPVFAQQASAALSAMSVLLAISAVRVASVTIVDCMVLVMMVLRKTGLAFVMLDLPVDCVTSAY